MIKNRKLTLEQRISRLEKLLNTRVKSRKFEGVNSFESELRTLIERGLEDSGCFIASSDWDGRAVEIDIQDDMDDEEYCDGWECDYATYRVEFDGRMYNVTVNGNFSEPDLGSFHSLRDVADAILYDRGIE